MYPLATGRLRKLTVLAISVTTAITLTACSADSNDSADPASADKASASASPKGAVTVKQAESILDRYEVTNSKANKTQDGKLLGTVEAGQVHEQSLADYKQLPTWPKDEQADYEKPFTYTSRQYLIPASGQSWFAVKAKSSGTKDAAIHATRTPDFYGTRTRGGGSREEAADDADTGADTGEDGEAPSGKKEKEDRNYVKAMCKCTPAAVIRVSPKTLSSRNIMCGDCMENFALEESD
ncbi:hypothetical protein [Streptomyces ureilyticus]|uniref:DUF8094 domain-containing protein n=1 Tax=Streptomyces ureilyticus TaxID=1775131 RepID=A0ABX0DN82_9ACTN|nr:hypothetical protein [Streptomyces ureilyticus]NGO40637.1 hypothetical protein [Streptomyces ureilyticus]